MIKQFEALTPYQHSVELSNTDSQIIYDADKKRRDLEIKYADRIYYEKGLGETISYGHAKKQPISRLFRYKEAFSPKLVNYLVDYFGLTKNDYILDPFAGMGTTCFSAMQKGIPSVGVEIMPMSHFVAKTLVEFGDSKKILGAIKSFKRLKDMLPNAKLASVTTEARIIKLAYDDETLIKLRKWKWLITNCTKTYKNILYMAFLSILEDCSYTAKDGQFLRIRRDKKIKNPNDALEEKLQIILEDSLGVEQHTLNQIIPKIILGDARCLPKYFTSGKKPNVIITSPPYLNRYDYTRSYALESYFYSTKDNSELVKLRHSLLRSHIESKKYDEDDQQHPAVIEVLQQLKNKELNNPRIPIMIAGYFTDMKKTILGMSRVIATRSQIALVIDNVRFEGEVIPVDLILSDIAEEIGFNTKKILITRYKGNSSQQMGKYGRIPVRESIVIWER